MFMNIKTRILVVDDEPSVRTMLKKLLVLHGHTVDTAGDGSEAIDRLESHTYGLMILDRFMPVMDGLTTAGIIRSSPKYKSMKILMLTGGSITKDVDDSFEAGVDGYVVKPFSIKNLIEKIAEIQGRINKVEGRPLIVRGASTPRHKVDEAAALPSP